jgi:hypothetical protein
MRGDDADAAGAHPAMRRREQVEDTDINVPHARLLESGGGINAKPVSPKP